MKWFTNLWNKDTSIDIADSEITRCRWCRWVALPTTIAVVMVMSHYITSYVLTYLLEFPELVSKWAGVIVGGWVNYFVVIKSIIVNKTTQSFVTTNVVLSFLGANQILVTYGPGWHITFWWESRASDNNIDISADTRQFTVKVQMQGGEYKVSGEMIFRPDLIQGSREFLSGGADEALNVVKAEVMSWFSQKSTLNNIISVADANTHLKKMFVDTRHPSSRDFGIKYDAVLITKALESGDVRKTRGAATEANILAEGVMRSLCMMYGINPTLEEYRKAIEKKVITREDINRMTSHMRALSGNNDGVTRTEYDVTAKGLEGLTGETIANAAKAFSGAKNATTQKSGGKSNKGGKK